MKKKPAKVDMELKTYAAPTNSERRVAFDEVLREVYPEMNFLQSPAWASVNLQVGYKVCNFVDTEQKISCQMIVKNAKRGRYLEVPGGPLLNWQDQAAVTRVFEEMRQTAKAEKCVFVRLRPQLPKTEENMRLLAAQGAVPAPMHLHAEHTVMLNLTKSEDELLADMRRQTRYEVRRADRLNLCVEWGNSEKSFREFHEVQAETAARQHFVPPDLKTLLAERTAFGENARLYIVRTAEGYPVAYGLILIDGVEAEYFEAASTELNQKMPGSYALLWRAIRDLKALGLKRFNLWGIAPPGQKNHRYSGVTTFKTGFGGEVVEFVPAHDLIIKPLRYKINWLIEMARKKKRHL